MGTNPSDGEQWGEDGEGPPRRVRISPFAIGQFEISNARFANFVKATGYKTESEAFGWSFGVEALVPEAIKMDITNAVAAAPWWLPVSGADWRAPNGPGTSIEGVMTHPVTQVSHADAEAFCAWSRPGGRLPTEGEWEYAARGGLERKRFPWGDEEHPDGKHRANVWHTTIPPEQLGDKNLYTYGDDALAFIHHFYNAPNSLDDGWVDTAPVDAFGEQNAFGLYNIVGNVWEWASDWYTTEHAFLAKHASSERITNGKGTKKKRKGGKAGKKRRGVNRTVLDTTLEPLFNPTGPERSPQGAKVKKGGSFMCNPLTCFRYTPLTASQSYASIVQHAPLLQLQDVCAHDVNA
jgi:sulfatase modifying factor 1